MEKPITQAQAAEMLGVTLRHFQRITADGSGPPKLVNANGRASGFHCSDFGQWLRARWMAELGVGADGQRYDERLEKAKLLHYQARNERLKVEQTEGRLVNADDVLRAWSGHVTEAKAALLALPAKLAPELASVSDPVRIADIIRWRVLEVLSDLARGGSADGH